MTELLSYDEDAREASVTVRILDDNEHDLIPHQTTARYVIEQFETYKEPWPVDGDELTKRRMK